MYTIKQAALRSGVTIPLLRAWERRYGVVSPKRTAAGYRLYDDEAISRLAAMRRLVDAGWPASRAAEAVAEGTIVPVTNAVGTGSGGGAGPAAVQAGETDADDAESLVAGAAACDMGAIERAIDALFERGSFESVIDDRVLPAVAALGTAWADGRLDVAGEHLASAAVVRRLSVLFDNAGAAGSGAAVLVGLPPGSRHEIGVLACAVALRRRGMDVLYLGPDVPVASWVHAALEREARAAVVAVPTRSDVAAARDVVRALREVRPELIVAVGGPSADAAAVSSTATVSLPARVVEAAERIADLVRSG